MTDDLANIFGTEKDKVNCPFYFRIGACRHGDTCTRLHHKPSISQTLLLHHMYHHPYQGLSPEQVTKVDPVAAQQDFDDFYEDVFTELSKYGEIEDMMVCDNLCSHMVGNLYVKYVDEAAAQRAFMSVNGRFYGGAPIQAEYSPVTDFREAQCRQFELGECTRGAYCNFVHIRKVSKDVQRRLFVAQREAYHKERSRSRHHHRHHHRHHKHHHHRHHSSDSGSGSGSGSGSDSDSGSDENRSKSRSRSRSKSKSSRHRSRHHRSHHHSHSRSSSPANSKRKRSRSDSKSKDDTTKHLDEQQQQQQQQQQQPVNASVAPLPPP